MARAIKANVYENWTDVSGFLITDPRIIYKPEGIETITYKELRELAYMGVSVHLKMRVLSGIIYTVLLVTLMVLQVLWVTWLMSQAW